MFDRVDCDAHFEPDFEAFTETTVAFVVNNKAIIEGEPQGAEVQEASATSETEKGWSRPPFFRFTRGTRLLDFGTLRLALNNGFVVDDKRHSRFRKGFKIRLEMCVTIDSIEHGLCLTP